MSEELSRSTPEQQGKEARCEQVVLHGEDAGAEFAVILDREKHPAIRIGVGGHTIVMPAIKWFEAAKAQSSERGEKNAAPQDSDSARAEPVNTELEPAVAAHGGRPMTLRECAEAEESTTDKEAQSMPRTMFHWRDNIFFGQRDDGTVRIKKYHLPPASWPSVDEPEREIGMVFDISIPREEWASILLFCKAEHSSDAAKKPADPSGDLEILRMALGNTAACLGDALATYNRFVGEEVFKNDSRTSATGASDENLPVVMNVAPVGQCFTAGKSSFVSVGEKLVCVDCGNDFFQPMRMFDYELHPHADYPTDHPDRCRKLDDKFYDPPIIEDGQSRPHWRCHKKAGHDSQSGGRWCSTHRDCGAPVDGGICGDKPLHDGGIHERYDHR